MGAKAEHRAEVSAEMAFRSEPVLMNCQYEVDGVVNWGVEIF